jgi:hypothetical protein
MPLPLETPLLQARAPSLEMLLPPVRRQQRLESPPRLATLPLPRVTPLPASGLRWVSPLPARS